MSNAGEVEMIDRLLVRLEKRAKEDEDCAANSKVVADLLAPQIEAFEKPPGPDRQFNTYAFRMAHEHQKGAALDKQRAEDLRMAIKYINEVRSTIS
jgi:hypothetical protein